MNSEDTAIARTVRHELSRRTIDITRVDIQVVNGKVTLGGILLPLKDHPDTNLEFEVELILKQLMRYKNIKEASSNMRLIEISKVEEINARGRSRSR